MGARRIVLDRAALRDPAGFINVPDFASAQIFEEQTLRGIETVNGLDAVLIDEAGASATLT